MTPRVGPVRSLLVWRADDGSGDTPDEILGRVVDRLRRENAIEGARELSLAITHCQEAQHWLRDLAERRSR